MGIEINILEGGLSRSRPTPDMTAGLAYVKYVTGITPGEPAPSFTSATRITSFREAKKQMELDGTNVIYGDLYRIIEDFFRGNENGVLWVLASRVVSDPISFNKDDFQINELLTAASGSIRQLAVYGGLEFDFNTSQISDINNIVESYSNTEFCPVSTIYQAKYAGALPDLRALSAKRVSFVIAFEDGRNQGLIGMALGFISKAQVHQNIGWVEKFRLPVAVDTVVSTWDGGDVNTFSETDTQNFTDLGYVFVRRYPSYPGYYFNDSPACTAAVSDFAFVENNRTIDKAIREVRNGLMPTVNSSIYTDADGKLTPGSISYLESKGRIALENMLKSGELSGYDIYINPDQDVVTSSEVLVEISLNIVGVARKIIINIGFTV